MQPEKAQTGPGPAEAQKTVTFSADVRLSDSVVLSRSLTPELRGVGTENGPLANGRVDGAFSEERSRFRQISDEKGTPLVSPSVS